MPVTEVNFQSIGYFSGSGQQKYDVPRQAVLNPQIGTIHLNPGKNFEQALEDLSGFSHIWLVYLFDNRSWKPKVQSPRDLIKKGVFATRSPYRPNPIGLSCVELVDIKGLQITIKNFDLLDNTKILDIKPYIAYSDQFENAEGGWIEHLEKYQLIFSDQFYLDLVGHFPENPSRIVEFISEQLSYAPLGHPNKRVKSTSNQNEYLLAYKFHRICFEVSNQKILVTKIHKPKSEH